MSARSLPRACLLFLSKFPTRGGPERNSLGWLALLATCVLTLNLASPLTAQTVSGIQAVRVASGLSQPLFATAPPGDYNRLFIVTKGGLVQILNLQTGLLNATPFLDLSATVTTASEQGLLGLAFDPGYSSNGKFYLYFVVPGGAFSNGTTHVSQFKVSANPDVADMSEEKILLTFDHPQANHNGGWIGFSPRTGDENNLYIATGDGGNGDDVGPGHIEPGGNAQNLTTLLGKMLRIHVDSIAGTASIPADNPFIATAGARPEIFAYGLRNPFRDSFDRATGNLFIGDVGQGTREEVDVQKASNPSGGENFGWRVREGTIQNPSYPSATPPPGAINPIVDYPRNNASIPISGGTVTGGYVYRGRQIPNLRGTYVFGDYLNNKIFALNYDGTSASNVQAITSQLFPTATGGFTLSGPASFGEDANGEIYIVAINTGSVFKMVPTTPQVEAAAIMKVPGGSSFVSAYGVPFQQHTIQATSSLVEQFMPLATAVAGGDGLVQFEDTAPGEQRFYRITYP